MNTNYGISLGLDIPQLVCNRGVVVNGVDCNKPNIFGKLEDNPADLVGANELILLMINAFVDFFIQYYNIGETTNLEVILDLKKIIFSFTEPSSELELEQTLLYKFRKVCGIDVEKIRDEITIPTRVGFDGIGINNFPIRIKQKQMNLFLLGLSYKVLSMSGILDVGIYDMRYIIEKEKSRRNSFILQFLPVDNELPCFETVELCLLKYGNCNSEIYRKIMALVVPSGGGSRSRNIRNKKNKQSTRRRRAYKTKSRRQRHSTHYDK